LVEEAENRADYSKEKEWIQRQIEGASMLVQEYSPQNAGKPLTLEALDKAFAAWLASNPVDVKMINMVINCVGIAFGSFLISGAGLQWGVAIDKHGTEMVAHGQPGDILVYPANLVAKRWEKRETNFLKDVYDTMVADIAAVRKQ
jgi:hypothetical protein